MRSAPPRGREHTEAVAGAGPHGTGVDGRMHEATQAVAAHLRLAAIGVAQFEGHDVARPAGNRAVRSRAVGHRAVDGRAVGGRAVGRRAAPHQSVGPEAEVPVAHRPRQPGRDRPRPLQVHQHQKVVAQTFVLGQGHGPGTGHGRRPGAAGRPGHPGDSRPGHAFQSPSSAGNTARGFSGAPNQRTRGSLRHHMRWRRENCRVRRPASVTASSSVARPATCASSSR